MIDRLSYSEIKKVMNEFGYAYATIEEAIYGGHNIKELSFESGNLKRIPEWLGDMFPKLESLDFCNCDIIDLSPLVKCKNLKLLNLNNNFKLSDLSPLAKLDKVETLAMCSIFAKDYSPICKMKSLKEIHLNTEIKDIHVLSPLLNMKNLDIEQHGEMACSWTEIEFMLKYPNQIELLNKKRQKGTYKKGRFIYEQSFDR